MMDWAALVSRIRRQFDLPQAKFVMRPLAGGNINHAFRLDFGADRFFVKVNRPERLPMFEAERRGLEAIRNSGGIRAPEVFMTGSDGAQSYIVMEYIELSGSADPQLLARQLAALHQNTHQRFGFSINNTIGTTPQINSPSDDWVGFWQRHRLGFQLELGARQGLAHGLLDAGEKLNDGLAVFFTDYRPRPSLLHGDLWSGNHGADAAGNPVVYDPASYYGDHEADLAMMELFGNPGKRFFAAYNECFAIDPGYEQRRDLYNLYHVLNHANLFGGRYVAQAGRMIESLLIRL